VTAHALGLARGGARRFPLITPPSPLPGRLGASRLFACVLVATFALPTVFAAKRTRRSTRAARSLKCAAKLGKAERLLRRGTAALAQHGPDVLAAIAKARVKYQAAVEVTQTRGRRGRRARRLVRKARARLEVLSELEDALILLLALKPVDAEPCDLEPDPGYSMLETTDPEVARAMDAELTAPGQDPHIQVLRTDDLANWQALSVRALAKALRKAGRAGIQPQVNALVRTDLAVQGLNQPLERHLQIDLARISEVFQLLGDSEAQVSPSVNLLVTDDPGPMSTITRYQLGFRLQDVNTLHAAGLVSRDSIDQLHNTVQYRRSLDN
jgi:hypothetical protein